jgi:hypothetical protein
VSSQPPKPKWYSYWPKWRRIMLSGAVILLIGSLVPAIMGADAPTWLPNASLVIGYGFLAYGFFRAMGDRRAKQEWTAETKDGWSEVEPEEQEKG